MTQPHASHPARGFTLMEVLVAMAITLVLLFVATWIFSSTNAMVKMGLEKSEISSGVTYFDSRLREDVKGFIGPIPQKELFGAPAANIEGGALVIVPGMREGMLPDATGTLRHVSKLRCDQMVFFYGVNSPALPTSATDIPRTLTTLNPGAKDTQDVNGNGDTSEPALSGQARIWYGHVRRQGGEEMALDPVTGNSYEVAHHWILGRQAMLLLPPAAGTIQRDSLIPVMTTDTATYGDKSGGNNFNALQLFANTARNTPGSKAVNDPLTSASALNQYKGLLGTVDKFYLDTLIPGGSAAHCNALGADRLHESSQPLISTTPLADGKLTTGDLFASHLQAVANCSECIIQFAADLDKDGKVDMENIPASATDPAWSGATAYAAGNRVAYDDGAGNKIFYTANFNTTNQPPSSNCGQGQAWLKEQRIIWYPRDKEVFSPAGGLGIPGPFVFRADDWQSRTVRYPYKQDGRYYTNKFGDQFPYPWSSVGKAFKGYYYAASWNYAYTVAGLGNGRLYPWPAVYSDPQSLPDTATAHGGHSTNFGDGLDKLGDGTNPVVLPADLCPQGGTPPAFPASLGGWPSAAWNDGSANWWRPKSTGASGSGGDFASTDYTATLVPRPAGNGEDAAYGQLLKDYPQSADAGWRQRVSDWPWMIRIRLRVHDASGKYVTRNDDLPTNGRDDDGNGTVDDADGREGRAAGYWSEHIFAVPRPRWVK